MRRIWVENFDIVAFSSEITMPSDFNASVDGRAVTAEYEVSPKAVAEPRRGFPRSRNSAPSAVLNHLISDSARNFGIRC